MKIKYLSNILLVHHKVHSADALLHVVSLHRCVLLVERRKAREQGATFPRPCLVNVIAIQNL